MHISLSVVGDIIVDDVADTIHIEAAGSNVCSHQDIQLALLQFFDGALALGLSDVAIKGGGGEATC